MTTRFDEEMSSKEFNNHLKQIYEKTQSKEISRAIAKKQLELIHNKLSWNRLTYAVDYIINTFNLPFNFNENVRQYIIFNEISAPFNNFSITIEGSLITKAKSISNLPYLPIRIYAKLTNKELREIKERTESILAKRLPRYDGIKNIDQQIELDNWNRHKDRLDEVEKKRYKITAKEISKNVLKSQKKVQKVYDSTRSLQKLRKKRFGTE